MKTQIDTSGFTPNVAGTQTASGNGSKTLVIGALIAIALLVGYKYVYLPYKERKEKENASK